MANNNSPEPVFETNEQCTHFLTTLAVNSYFATLQDEIGELELLDVNNEGAIDDNGGAIENNKGANLKNKGANTKNEGASLQNGGAIIDNGGAYERIGGAFDEIGGAIEETFISETKLIKEKLIVLLSIIEKQQGLKSSDYRILTQLSIRSVERYIKLLREAGLIEFRGAATQKGGYYLTEKMNRKLGIN